MDDNTNEVKEKLVVRGGKCNIQSITAYQFLHAVTLYPRQNSLSYLFFYFSIQIIQLRIKNEMVNKFIFSYDC